MDLRAVKLELSRSAGSMVTMDEAVRVLIGSWRESQNQVVERPKAVEVSAPDRVERPKRQRKPSGGRKPPGGPQASVTEGALAVKPPPADFSAGGVPGLSDAEVDGFMEAVSEGREEPEAEPLSWSCKHPGVGFKQRCPRCRAYNMRGK